jgi:release factor glutamine methyltransferase
MDHTPNERVARTEPARRPTSPDGFVTPEDVPEREPVELATGRATFMGLELFVTRGVLVPREETELLGRTAIDTLRGCDDPSPRVIDMCCGAGNLAVAIAHYVPTARVWAADLTPPCVETARRNVREHGLDDRVLVLAGDLFTALEGLALEGLVDAVVCNPPYISTRKLETDRKGLLVHEPREAFDAGPYGLSIHQRVIARAAAFLRSGGWMFCEFGVGQSKQVEMLFDRTRQYGRVRFACDARGEPRVAIAQKQ